MYWSNVGDRKYVQKLISAFGSTFWMTASLGSGASGVGLAGVSLAGASLAGWLAGAPARAVGGGVGGAVVGAVVGVALALAHAPTSTIVASPVASSLRDVTWFLLSPGPVFRIAVPVCSWIDWLGFLVRDRRSGRFRVR